MRRFFIGVMFGALCTLNAFELEVDTGVGYHYTGANGDLVYTKEFWKDSSAKIEHESTPAFYLWMELDSDIKYFPKLLLEHSSLETKGRSFIHIDSTDSINTLLDAIDNALPISLNNTYYDSTLSLNTYEAFLFYEYFKESEYPSLGVGIGAKKFEFVYAATIIDGLEFTDNGGDTIPMLFFKSAYELEKESDGTQLSFEADGKLYVFGDSDIYDYRVKANFMMRYNNTTNLGIEIGYKNTFYDIKGQDINTVGGNMTTSGLFFGFVGEFR